MRLRNVIASYLFLISMFIAANEAKTKYCGEALVAKLLKRGLNSVSSSSEKDFYGSSAVSLGEDGWSPQGVDQHPWIRIDLGGLYLICGFAVQGCSDSRVESWVTRYRVQASPEENFWDSWNYIKPEFYGGKYAKEIAYSIAKERKVGRYVKIYPVSFESKKPKSGGSPCTKVEIYGAPYLRLNQVVFKVDNPLSMTYKKMTIQSINTNICTLKLVKGNGPPYHQSYCPDYTNVIPLHKPLKTEMKIDTCVLAPHYGLYISGRVHEIKGDRYSVEFLLYANMKKKRNKIQLHSFERKDLYVVFSAWCKKIDFVARVPPKNPELSGGQLVRIDSQLVFLQNQGKIPGLQRLSYEKENIRKEDFVSRKKIEPNKVKGGTKLWKQDSNGYLKATTAPFSEKVNMTEWLENHNVQWYRDYGGPEECSGGEKRKNQCFDSRIPFTVVRQNCAIAKVWDGKKCTDEDECSTGMAACGFYASCKNIPGYYKCFCPKGFSGKNPRTEDCKDIDECKKKVCQKNAICKNTVGSFVCQCKKGFRGDGRKTCVDIDECKVPANKEYCEKHKNAFCKNVPGGYHCACKPGYHGNFKHCKDLDECSVERHKCSRHAVCTNTIGSYRCECRKGFSGDGRNCKDIEECKDPAKQLQCHSPHGHCVDTLGGYECQCKEGYFGDGIKSCVLANECELGIHKCHKTWATCVNTQKSYDCHCKKGFEGDGLTCKDIDECAMKEDDCGVIANGIECVNTNGSYKCVCAKGFTGNGKTCVNIDECKTGAHNCVKNAICTDSHGTFTCTCRAEYFGDPTKRCDPETPCMKALPHCDVPRAVCSGEKPEQFGCYCKPGFTGNNSNCTDIDECFDKDVCSKDAVCINTVGNFSCRCNDGFVGNGFICSDVNECSNSTICPPNAQCVNTHGSYECQCKTGFTGENPYKQCSDVDECKELSCDFGQKCTNTFGSYDCSCDVGYKLTDPVKNRCEDIDECEVDTYPCGKFKVMSCENMLGDYWCRCKRGFEFNREEKKCQDIDECNPDEDEELPCAEKASCNNNDGGYSCACPAGYFGDGKHFCEANSSPSNKAKNVWTFMVAMVTALLISTPPRV